jgi:hypothetical protein
MKQPELRGSGFFMQCLTIFQDSKATLAGAFHEITQLTNDYLFVKEWGWQVDFATFDE